MSVAPLLHAAAASAQAAPPWLPVAIIGGFLVIFPLFWLAICRLLALFGWDALAARYRFDGAFPDGTQRFGAASLSIAGRWRWLPVNYNNCTVMVIRPEALYIRVWRIFGVGHPPLKLPWRAITSIEQTSILFFPVRAVTLAGCDKSLLLRGNLATSIESAWQRHRQ